MSNNVTVSAVESGAELLQAWEEAGAEIYLMPDWEDAIDEGRYSALVARKDQAVGWVTIRWDGPIAWEEQFVKVVAEHYPEEPIPTIYLLDVLEPHRRQGIATKLMLAAESFISERPSTVAKAALRVRVENQPAISLYRKLGYHILLFGKQGAGTILEESSEPDGKGDFVIKKFESWAMAKDLSDLNHKE